MARLPTLGDLAALVQAQAEALAALPMTLTALNRSLRSLTGAVDQGRDAIVALQRLTVRMDGLMDELEEPMRALAPGLRRLAVVLDDPIIDELPETLRRVQQDLLPVVRGLKDTQQKVALIASSTDRITSLVDEAGARLGALPGAALLRRPRRPADAPVDD